MNYYYYYCVHIIKKRNRKMKKKKKTFILVFECRFIKDDYFFCLNPRHSETFRGGWVFVLLFFFLFFNITGILDTWRAHDVWLFRLSPYVPLSQLNHSRIFLPFTALLWQLPRAALWESLDKNKRNSISFSIQAIKVKTLVAITHLLFGYTR